MTVDDRFYMANRPIEGGHIKSVFVTGGRLVLGETDKVTGAAIVISIPHRKVHEGVMFEISYKSPEGGDIADNGTIAFLLRTGAKYDHLVFGGNAGGDAELELLEAVGVTDAGTAMVEHNMNRTSVNTAVTTAFRDPTVAGGTLLFNILIPGGTGGNSAGGSGAVRVGTEWILAANQDYAIRLTNRAGNAQPMSLAAQWYEESNN